MGLVMKIVEFVIEFSILIVIACYLAGFALLASDTAPIIGVVLVVLASVISWFMTE